MSHDKSPAHESDGTRRIIMNRRGVSGVSLRTFIGCIVALWTVGFASAQTPTGVIEGTVSDTMGGVLASAVVTVRNADNNQTRTATTASAGSNRFAHFPART